MTAPAPSPVLCSPWATADDLTDEQLALTADPAVWARWLLVASEVLYALSGRRWRGAGCTAEFTADRTAGTCGCRPVRSCRHVGSTRLRLPETPAAVLTVAVDGALLPAEGWLLRGPWLHRLDGACWPADGGRTVVTYTYGHQPPAAGVAAAVELAEQLLRAATGDDACRLPERVTSISRQGVDMTMLDPQDFLTAGRTGLYRVDLFLAAENPGGRHTRPSTVWSPPIAAAGHRRAV